MSRSKPRRSPEFPIDRSLGELSLPGALRDRGEVVHTLRSIYGSRRSQDVRDEEWLELAGANDWVVLTKDSAIRRRPAELAAIQRHAVRVFCLTSAGLMGEDQIRHVIDNLNRIIQRSQKPGPFVDGISRSGVRRLWPS